MNFKDRASSETAAQAWASGLDIDGEVVAVRWGRGKTQAGGAKPPLPTPVATNSASVE